MPREDKSSQVYETKLTVFGRDGWACLVCGRPATTLAHVIPQTKFNLAKYGPKRIHHPSNLGSCCERLDCNAAMDIGKRPLLVQEQVEFLDGCIVLGVTARSPILDTILREREDEYGF